MASELGEMMPRFDLHSALLLGSALVLPAAPAASAAPADGFVAPATPVVLTRELRRTLIDGKELVTRRKYELRFVPLGEGWRIDGVLLGCEVDAPAELAPLAEIERRRPDIGLFPLMLDRDGMIIAQRGAKDSAPAANAHQEVEKAVERVALAPVTRAYAGDMAGRIVAVGKSIGGNWPADLFRPANEVQTQERELALPDGKSGKVIVSVDSRRSVSGLMQRFSRMITTQLDGSSRNSSETFTISN